MLRTCNQLLRRLSKGHNAVLCGRILIFLARLLPLSDRSGINLQVPLKASLHLPVLPNAFALGCPVCLAHLHIVSYDACSLIGCVKRVMIVTPFKCRVLTTQPTRHPLRRSQRCVADKPLHAVRHVRHSCTSP